MSNFLSYLPLVFQGTIITIAAWIVSSSLSLLLGISLGVISCRHLKLSTTTKIIRIFTFIIKGIPAYVQILIAYFVLPSLLGINVSGFVAATGALAICSSGYITEIIRGGINSIPKGQWDAAFVLGYSLPSAIKYIIFPQTIKIVMPAIVGELEQLLKSTSLLATIGVTELTRAGMNIISRELNPLPIYLIIASVYLLFSGILNMLIIYIERESNYDRY